MEQLNHPGLSELEQYAAELLAPARLAELEAHTKGCPACAARLADITSDRREFLARHPPAAMARELMSRDRPAPLFGGKPWALALPAAACLALVLLHREPTADSVRFKGAAAISVWAHPMAGRSFELRPESVHAFAPGDELRVRMTAAAAGHAALWAVDAQGQGTRLQETAVSPGAALDWAVRVDASPEADRLFVITSEAELGVQQVQAAIAQAHRAANADLVAMKGLDLGAAVVRSYLVPKAQREGSAPDGEATRTGTATGP